MGVLTTKEFNFMTALRNHAECEEFVDSLSNFRHDIQPFDSRSNEGVDVSELNRINTFIESFRSVNSGLKTLLCADLNNWSPSLESEEVPIDWRFLIIQEIFPTLAQMSSEDIRFGYHPPADAWGFWNSEKFSLELDFLENLDTLYEFGLKYDLRPMVSSYENEVLLYSGAFFRYFVPAKVDDENERSYVYLETRDGEVLEVETVAGSEEEDRTHRTTDEEKEQFERDLVAFFHAVRDIKDKYDIKIFGPDTPEKGRRFLVYDKTWESFNFQPQVMEETEDGQRARIANNEFFYA